jgi:hypothetical protein
MKGERVLAEGLIAGGIGYATVVVLFLGLNVLLGQPAFHTPALLGGALFYGGSTTIEAAPVLAYNGVHLLVFLAVGLVGALLVTASEAKPEAYYVAFFALLAIGIGGTGFVVALTARLGDALPAWTVLVANAAALGAMGLFLWRAHPRLPAAIERYQQADALEEPGVS